jgi:membrane protease YdiL (CAAX protease family)
VGRAVNLVWKRAIALIIAGLIGAFAVIPHLLEHLAEFLGFGTLVAAAVAAGTSLAPRAGLGTPIIDAALTAQPFARRALSVCGLAIGLGLATALAVVALDFIVFSPLLARAQTTSAASAPPLWTGTLYAFYGGLTEEILFRYGAMSALAWLLSRLFRAPVAYWGAIVGASLLFGVAHLPATVALLPLTPLVVTRTMVLIGLAGVAFGWVYWRRGLEAAMVSHGAAALILHVGVPAIGA